MFKFLPYIAMSDIINNQLSYLIPQKAQEISDNFAELKEILTQYEEQIFMSLSDIQEDFNNKVEYKRLLIARLNKSYRILKQWYEFIKQIRWEISGSKKFNRKKWYLRFQDTHNIIWEILYEYWYDYKIKWDNRMKEFNNSREAEAYIAIRDALKNFIAENKKQWVEINFSESWTSANFIIILISLSEDFLGNKKQAEVLSEIPELENENYKIDEHLSVEEKLKSWRTKEIDFHWIIYLQKDLSPEQRYKDDKAYVREYLEWVDKECIWEQKFNREAVKKLWLVNKLPKNFKEFKKIRWNNHQDFVNKYFSKNNKSLFSGYWNRGAKWFFDVGDKEHCWLSNGRHVLIDKKDITYYGNNHCFGHSIRLVKGR